MALSDLTREAVLQAIAEYDALTPGPFLAKHGFAEARRYWLAHEGRHYPSKAIAGVAHGYLAGQTKILESASFTGGEASVVRVLRNLGFAIDNDLSHEQESPSGAVSPLASASLPSGRVWVTSFWGFNPEADGYLGFTREGDRNWFLREWRPGDLVMVYATMGDSTAESDRGRIMGFLEVEPRTIRDVDRMTPDGRQWKIENGVADRWTFALPVVRAWRAVDLPLVREIAPVTLGPGANWQLIASRGAPLSPEEAVAALQIRVRPVDVHGETPLSEDEKTRIHVPSRGFPMSFGRRSFETKDGEHFLYALQLVGDVAAIMGEAEHLVRGKSIVKVGLAKDPNDRCSQHNSCLPPAAKMRWKLLLRSRAIIDGDTALAAETELKATFSRIYRSLGGEFFLCDDRTLAAEFAQAQSRPGKRAPNPEGAISG